MPGYSSEEKLKVKEKVLQHMQVRGAAAAGQIVMRRDGVSQQLVLREMHEPDRTCSTASSCFVFASVILQQVCCRIIQQELVSLDPGKLADLVVWHFTEEVQTIISELQVNNTSSSLQTNSFQFHFFRCILFSVMFRFRAEIKL